MRLVVDLHAAERCVIEVSPEERLLLTKYMSATDRSKVATALVEEAYKLARCKQVLAREVPDWSRGAVLFERIFGIGMRTA